MDKLIKILVNATAQKIKSSALFIVIVIALVIGLLTSVVILISYHYKQYIYDDALLQRLESNLNSGINLLLAEEETFPFNDLVSVDLFDEGTDSVLIKKTHWGVWDVAMVKALANKKQIMKSFLFGNKLDREFNSAIYLSDFGRPLSVAGKTTIVGDCYLPEAGVKRAYIEGESFQGTEMVDGQILKSKSELPEFDMEIADFLTGYLERETLPDSLSLAYDEMEKDTLKRLFSDSTLFINISEITRLDNKAFYGNIVLWSDTVLTITSSVILEDVIIFAAGIKVEEGFKGSMQAFAKDSIVISKECVLKYPTALGVFKIDFQTMQPFITVGEGSVVTGQIFTLQKLTDLKQSRIAVLPEAIVYGQIYADGFLDVRGKVFGNVTCNKFMLKTPSTAYENHLLSAVINRTRLSTHFVGSCIFGEARERSIVKYME